MLIHGREVPVDSSIRNEEHGVWEWKSELPHEGVSSPGWDQSWEKWHGGAVGYFMEEHVV